MKIIDGAQGEGGGQIFRTSLTLSACLGLPVQIKNIRAGRRKPGLLRQHLTCLRAAQEICNAEVSGAKLGSQAVVFVPGKVQAGKYRFSIGSAGSTTLVFQTICLPLLFSDGESHLCLEGGTHNGMAPSFDFIKLVYLSELKKMGGLVDATLDRFGFYPAGGGAWTAYIRPAVALGRYKNLSRGELLALGAVATSAQIPEHVVDRELRRVSNSLAVSPELQKKRLVKSVGPGNILSLQASFENITEIFEAIGERSLSAEKVADKAVSEYRRYEKSTAVVGEYLADQLLLPMALGAGGSFLTMSPSMHLKTNAKVIQQLTQAKITLEQTNKGLWRVEVVGHENTAKRVINC